MCRLVLGWDYIRSLKWTQFARVRYLNLGKRIHASIRNEASQPPFGGPIFVWIDEIEKAKDIVSCSEVNTGANMKQQHQSTTIELLPLLANVNELISPSKLFLG